MIKLNHFHTASAMAMAMLIVPHAAMAQDAAKADDNDSKEIIVTAQRTSQNVMSVPLSIQAYTGDQLQESGIKTLTDLQFTTSNYMSSSVSGFTQIFIRGVGNSILAGADPSVATFVDDVPLIYDTVSDNFVNVQRVEVLKGAQGGLYGRNSTGGAVNIITRQPNTQKIEGTALLDYGEKNTFRGAAYINLPLNDQIAVNLSVEHDSHDAYVKNIATAAPYTAAMFPTGAFVGTDQELTPQQTADALNAGVHVPALATQRFWAVNSKILFKPTNNFKITLSGDYSDKHDSNGNQNVAAQPGALQDYLVATMQSVGIFPQLPAGFEQPLGGKFTSSVGDRSIVYDRQYGASATMVWNAPGVDITSISAYRKDKYHYEAGAFSGTVPLVTPIALNNKWYAYQELRGVSTAEGPFHWIAGATYLRNNFAGRNSINLLNFMSFPATVMHNVVDNWSVYGQASYDITDALSLTVSGRYVHETNNASFSQPAVSSSRSVEKKFIPSATLNYALDGGTVYARWARGFKAGGVNPAVPPSAFPNPSDGSVFGPETVDTYEVGYRQSLLNHRLQVTFAGFYNDYKNLQYADHAKPDYASTVILAIVNGKSARTYGVEGSVNWRVTDPLTLGVNAGYVNAKYKNFVMINNPVLADFDLSGHQMINSPKFQLTLSANLDQPLNDKLRLVGNVMESHLSRILFQESAMPGVVPDSENPGYWLTNLRIGVKTTDDKYSFSVFANNLFNQSYYVFGNSNIATNSLNWGNPRIIGAELGVNF